MFPQLSNIAHVEEIDTRKKNQSEVGSSKSLEGDSLYTEHKVYASLLQVLRKLPSVPEDCVWAPYSASSTNNRQHESLIYTKGRSHRAFYGETPHWSSTGQKDPNVHETLIYKLHSDLCVITEICIQPFEAVSQPGNPIYSSKSVRFRMGHQTDHNEMQYLLPLPCSWELAVDKFIWTYTSEEFPMSQENRLQHFKFKEPLLCIGRYLEIQLLGRVQRKETDGLFYICISLVEVMGQPVTLQFRAGLPEPNGKLTLWKLSYVKYT